MGRRRRRRQPLRAPLLAALAVPTAGGSSGVKVEHERPPKGFGYEPPQVTGADGAYTDCPCVVNDIVASSVWTVNGTVRGSRCGAWDEGVHPACLKDPPVWCFSRWCYVDPNNCKRLTTRSPSEMTLSYSYETCGDLGSHFADFLSLPLTKRVARPLYVYAAGFRVSKSQPARPDINLNLRATLSFAAHMMDKLGLDPDNRSHIRYRQLSPAALSHNPSSRYTACIHDIALGNLDLCLGPVWDTDERRAMNVSFTGSIFVEDMYLLLPSSYRERITLLSVLWKTFEPFSTSLWTLIGVTIALSSLAMVAFEHWFTPAGDLRRRAEVRGLERSVGTTLTAWLHSFLASEITLMPMTSGGKVFSVGYGFFVLVCISCYTANMATILIGEGQNGAKLDTIPQALESGLTVCYHAALPMSTVKFVYPGLEKLGHKVDGSVAGVDVWRRHGCTVSIASEMMVADEWANRTSCDYFLSGTIVMSVSNGFYSSNTLAHEVSWMASKMRLDGTWDRIIRELTAPPICGSQDDAGGGFAQLTASQMSGALVVLIICFGLGLVVHAYELAMDETRSNSFEEGSDVGTELSDCDMTSSARQLPMGLLDEARQSPKGLMDDSQRLRLERTQLKLVAALRELQEMQEQASPLKEQELRQR